MPSITYRRGARDRLGILHLHFKTKGPIVEAVGQIELVMADYKKRLGSRSDNPPSDLEERLIEASYHATMRRFEAG